MSFFSVVIALFKVNVALYISEFLYLPFAFDFSLAIHLIFHGQSNNCHSKFVMDIMQDIPDIEGDKIFGIRSYTVRLGQERVG